MAKSSAIRQDRAARTRDAADEDLRVLMTPMAANFNIVPTALLELPDQYAVIKVQIPSALLLLAANTVLMAVFVYRW